MAYTPAYSTGDFGAIIFDILGGVGAGIASFAFLYGQFIIIVLIMIAITSLVLAKIWDY